MSQRNQDVTEAELALLQSLWDAGPATIRQLVERVYQQSGTSVYATVQKLLDRLEAKGCVTRDRNGPVHVFAGIDRPRRVDWPAACEQSPTRFAAARSRHS